jgi:hypothetical protein
LAVPSQIPDGELGTGEAEKRRPSRRRRAAAPVAAAALPEQEGKRAERFWPEKRDRYAKSHFKLGGSEKTAQVIFHKYPLIRIAISNRDPI